MLNQNQQESERKKIWLATEEIKLFIRQHRYWAYTEVSTKNKQQLYGLRTTRN